VALLAELLEDLAHPRVGLRDRVEVPAIELQELRARGRGDGGRAGLAGEDRDLAEELALTHLPHLDVPSRRVLDERLDAARREHEEAVSGLPLGDDDVAGIEAQQVEPPHHGDELEAREVA
jgi:hypothetical protein